MLFMIVEQFRNADPLPIYRRFRDHGRLAGVDPFLPTEGVPLSGKIPDHAVIVMTYCVLGTRVE